MEGDAVWSGVTFELKWVDVEVFELVALAELLALGVIEIFVVVIVEVAVSASALMLACPLLEVRHFFRLTPYNNTNVFTQS